MKDIRESVRITSRGLTNVLCDLMTFMFAGDVFSLPSRAVADLSLLVSHDTALVFMPAGKNN